MAFLDNNAGTLRARFYFSLSSYLHKKRWLLRLVQVLRASIVLGPFRKPIVRYYQKFGHNDPLNGLPTAFDKMDMRSTHESSRLKAACL